MARVLRIKEVHGFDETVKRLRSAQKKKLDEQEAYKNLGKSTDALWQKAQHDFDEGPKPFQLGPKRFYGHDARATRQEEEERGSQRLRDEIILAMDVDLGWGKTGRIGIRKGDRPTDLARDFAQVYKLDVAAEGRLARIIESQMRQKKIQIGTL